MKILDIEDRLTDYNELNKLSLRAEQGIRAICFMYDEHSSDKNSEREIFILKNNVHYRMFSLVHQYLIFLRELNNSEQQLQELYQKNPRFINSFPFENPYFQKVQLEVSSVFDNIVFQLSSVFDYLSHLICYVCKKDKSDTLYWTKLAKSANDTKNEFSNLDIRKTITEVDRDFVKRLYDYRSRLLHVNKDQHIFKATLKIIDYRFIINTLASETSIKHFKAIRKDYPEESITLTFLSSWLIRRTFIEIEKILDALREEILKKSAFHLNFQSPKTESGFMLITIDPKTNYVRPVSDGLWEEYKNMI